MLNINTNIVRLKKISSKGNNPVTNPIMSLSRELVMVGMGKLVSLGFAAICHIQAVIA